MNIENKKTALDDDSLLYQKRDDSLGKKDTSGLSAKQKAGYFKDYYLARILVILAVLAAAAYLVYTIFFRHQETILNIAVVGDCMITDSEALTDMLRDSYGLTSEDQLITVFHYDLTDIYQQMAFSTRMAAEDIDLLICDREQFETFCNEGTYSDLTEVLPDTVYETFSSSGKILTGHTVETDAEGNITRTGLECSYGIEISDSSLYTSYGGSGTAILGIAAYTQRQESISAFLELIQNWIPDVETDGTEGVSTD